MAASANQNGEIMSTNSPPRVFISYSWSSDEHTAWVLELATRLRQGAGIDVILDRWDLKPGQDKYRFMESMVADETVAKVLVICEPTYTTKADSRRGGVGTESMIISQEVYENAAQRKFIPIIAEKNDDGTLSLPIFLKNRIYIDLSDPLNFEERFEDLVREIYGRPVYTAPPLGLSPSFLEDGAAPIRPAVYKYRAFEAAIVVGKTTAVGLAEDYFNTLDEELDSFQLSATDKREKEVWDDVVVRSIEASKPLRDEFIQFSRTLAKYDSSSRLMDSLHAFFERLLARADTDGRLGTRQDNFVFLAHELFLGAIAVFLERRDFAAVNFLLSQGYRVATGDAVGSISVRAFGAFSYTNQSLDGIRQQRLDGGNFMMARSPLTGRLLAERADTKELSLESLVDADMVMFVRSCFGGAQEDNEKWSPVTLTTMRNIEVLPTFSRAAYRQYFSQLKIVLGIESREELADKITAATQQQYFSPFRSLDVAYVRRRINLDALDTR